ncbi:hypothetical protein cyc_01201 [Cyclospora cayetanensis]|uniref:Transmembrane protein n=1 Tax=Cyclospora cayetanensis TaxID=88456 RepID=A0A1D3CXZ7_9EIME|nr:hypothetical protein cyc_01201 [Cyclospora cayetanensis]
MGTLYGCLPLHYSSSSSNRWRRFLRRCCRPSQLDIQYSAVQCKLLLSNPSRLYSLAALRQKQQQSCAREDPAFLLLLLLILLLTGIGHAAALQATGAATFAAAALAPLALFFISALLIIPAAFVCLHRSSSASTSVSSGRSSSSSSGGPSPFDLAFSFDLHCNGSFVFAMYTQVVPLLLQPLLLLLPAPVRKWLAAALHCYGFWCYTYVSAMGYLAVGRLKSAAPLLLSAFGCIAVVICCAAAGVDLSFCPTRLVLQAMLNTAPVEPAVVAVPAITTAQPDLPLQ